MIDLGNGVKTNAQLTIPAVGNGPFPGVLLIAGSGAEDMNETWAISVLIMQQEQRYIHLLDPSFKSLNIYLIEDLLHLGMIKEE